MAGVPVETSEIAESTALGAAYLAGLAVGFWDGEEDVERRWRLSRCYQPKMAETERETLYAGWQRAVERSRSWAEPG